MSPTKVLLGQIAVVFGIVTLALMLATQWTAGSLGYQAELGHPWTVLHGVPLYQPWLFFVWWFQFDAYPPWSAKCAVSYVGRVVPSDLSQVS